MQAKKEKQNETSPSYSKNVNAENGKLFEAIQILEKAVRIRKVCYF